MTNIFTLIKSKKFDETKKYIETTENIDVNMVDEQHNYLIHYILLYDQYEILKIILKKNVRLDILDIDGRTILHIPIRFNYIETLKLLLKYNKELIGISILDIKDKLGLTALHYCVILNNFECLKLLISSDADPLIRDKTNNNVMHLSLQYHNIEIINYLLDIMNLNFLTFSGETILQLAIQYKFIDLINLILKKKININNQEYNYGISALHQSVLINNPQITDTIIKYGANINLQDYIGNTALIYALNDNLIDIVKILISYPTLNYNLINYNGETALHYLFTNFEKYTDYPNIIKKLIINTDLNIQDNNGNTCLHYIVKNNLMDDYSEELENKILNIFIKDNNNISVYDFIKNDKNKLNIIVNSFYNYLKQQNDKLTVDWEIKCGINELDEIKCKEKIYDQIVKEQKSLPSFFDSELILDNGIYVRTCFYTGLQIDILFGLLFVFNKFKNEGLNLILDYPLTTNNELERYYTTLGIENKLDFSNILISWSYQKLIFPSYFDHEIKKQIANNNYLIIPIGIEISSGSHANILFIDIKNAIVERFEPNGSNSPKNYNYNHKLLDQLLEIKFKQINSNFTYIKPLDYLPIVGFQMLENINQNKCKHIGDPNGFCGVWCFWWVYHKLKNIHINSKILAPKLITEIKFKNIKFKELIRSFSKNITDLRDSFLNKYNIDINDFLVEKINHNFMIDLEKDILSFIK